MTPIKSTCVRWYQLAIGYKTAKIKIVTAVVRNTAIVKPKVFFAEILLRARTINNEAHAPAVGDNVAAAVELVHDCVFRRDGTCDYMLGDGISVVGLHTNAICSSLVDIA